MVPDVTPAVSVCAVVAYTNWLAAAPVTVSVWVAAVSRLSLAVSTKLPEDICVIAPKLALLALLAMVTLVIAVFPVALSRN